MLEVGEEVMESVAAVEGVSSTSEQDGEVERGL